MRHVKLGALASALLAIGLVSVAAAQGTPDTYQVINRYPHDPGAFTQGLIFDNGLLYESTGLHGRSSLREVDLATGAVRRRVNVPAEYFAEGMTMLEGRIYQLTWQSQVGFIYDAATLAQVGQFSYMGEGWGLTHDRHLLIMSDGTNRIRFLDPVDFRVVRTIGVVDGSGDPVTRLNELEYIEGQIYANVWQTNAIARIDPASGRILGWIDLAGLLPAGTPGDVLNGIAYDAASRRLFVTGKLWPYLFEIRVIPRSSPPAPTGLKVSMAASGPVARAAASSRAAFAPEGATAAPADGAAPPTVPDRSESSSRRATRSAR